MVRRLVLSTVLALLLAAAGTRVALPWLADSVAHRASRWAAALPAPQPEEDVATDDPPAPMTPPPPSLTPAPTPSRGTARAPTSPPAYAAALDIPEGRVAHLSARQLRGLSASDAIDETGRPLGARLRGFAALGVGLADGDVVTSIDGVRTPDTATATSAAMGAYAAGRPVVHGTVIREGRTIAVLVHVPPHPAPPKG